jgi:hypothetical protein
MWWQKLYYFDITKSCLYFATKVVKSIILILLLHAKVLHGIQIQVQVQGRLTAKGTIVQSLEERKL